MLRFSLFFFDFLVFSKKAIHFSFQTFLCNSQNFHRNFIAAKRLFIGVVKLLTFTFAGLCTDFYKYKSICRRSAALQLCFACLHRSMNTGFFIIYSVIPRPFQAAFRRCRTRFCFILSFSHFCILTHF